MKLLFALSVFIFCSHLTFAADLFKNGKSEYKIAVMNNDSETENTAAKELQDYIRKIGNVELPVVKATTSDGKYIVVGWCEETGTSRPKNTDEGFTYVAINDNLYIYGGKDRGTMYGVFSFLEKELGVRWLSSSCTYVPKLNSYSIPASLNRSEKPAIKRRLDFYCDALNHHDWGAHNLMNTQYLLSHSQYGDMSAFWGIHTFKTLISPNKYFVQHPEYFSVRNGARSDKAQLCFANKNMRKELIKNLKEVIKNNPGYWCYDVSQNDISAPCECSACRNLAKKYGGESGAMLWFVNLVANEVKKTYPNVYIGTFAYRYTRQAPKSSIKPAENVVVRLCDIECCMAHNLDECEANASFLSDFSDWQKITNRIFIWDYTTGFTNYLLPFPNFKTIASHFRYFAQHNVIGVMEQGNHEGAWGEWSEMKQWMIAKLLWNPEQDVDSLASDFITHYYGKGANQIWEYYQLNNNQIDKDTHFTIKVDWNSNLYDDKFIEKGLHFTNEALLSANDKSIEKRINRIKAQLLYLRLKRNPAASYVNGTFSQLQDIIKQDDTFIREPRYTFEQMMKDSGYR